MTQLNENLVVKKLLESANIIQELEYLEKLENILQKERKINRNECKHIGVVLTQYREHPITKCACCGKQLFEKDFSKYPIITSFKKDEIYGNSLLLAEIFDKIQSIIIGIYLSRPDLTPDDNKKIAFLLNSAQINQDVPKIKNKNQIKENESAKKIIETANITQELEFIEALEINNSKKLKAIRNECKHIGVVLTRYRENPITKCACCGKSLFEKDFSKYPIITGYQNDEIYGNSLLIAEQFDKIQSIIIDICLSRPELTKDDNKKIAFLLNVAQKNQDIPKIKVK